MSRRTLKLRIEIDVTTPGDRKQVAPMIASAMQELVNRADFIGGTIRDGRALTHHHDHGDHTVTVDILRMTHDPARRDCDY